jgi:tetraacyldisaccharide 4'-kinase
MRAPGFWWRETPSLVARLLWPAGAVYGAVTAYRMARARAQASLPVICVGNFVAGGAGKTPTALAVAKLLTAIGEKPAFLSRGYGGSLAGPVAVDAKRHSAAEVGDEPLLLARKAVTIVARHRPAGATLAAKLGATVVVMDDGLQNPSLNKDLALAVVDGATGVGNGLCMPAGPLRAPLAWQLPRVHAVVVVGSGAAGQRVAAMAADAGVPVIKANMVAAAIPAASLRGKRVLAFAGIGHPEKFFATLAQAGALVIEQMAFPDHHVFTDEDVRRIFARADAMELVLVTTEKDAARLAKQPNAKALAGQTEVLPVSLYFDHDDRAREVIATALGRWRKLSGFRHTPPPNVDAS